MGKVQTGVSWAAGQPQNTMFIPPNGWVEREGGMQAFVQLLTQK